MALNLPRFAEENIIASSDMTNILKDGYDTLCFVGPSLNHFKKHYSQYCRYFEPYESKNANFYNYGNTTLVVNESSVPNKLLFAPTGPLTEVYDDVRAFRDATIKAMECAYSSGSENVAVASMYYSDDKFCAAPFVTAAAAYDANYLPPDVRSTNRQTRFKKLSIVCNYDEDAELVKQAATIDFGKTVMKDIGGGEPEQATSINIQHYVENIFANSPIQISVFNSNQLEKEFPLLSAVDRGCQGVDRHRGCMIELEYMPKGNITETIFLVGKGITYDTGGVDLKVHGMRFMSFDKCGAAAVAGFMKIVAEVQPSNLRVIGMMAMARNDIGPAAYVCDEIITARSGVKVCIGNTDAEGRMAMADVLCYAKEKAISSVNPSLFTIATLTGHVGNVYGPGYAAAIENGPAIKASIGLSLHFNGSKLADPVEISYLRKEDYEFVKYKGDRANVMQCNDLPSSRTPRGHIFPAAFLIYVSGLDKHGNDLSSKPLPYCHLDIASAIESKHKSFMDHPQAAVLTSLAKHYNLI
ncbi:hypothetical protein GJ496_010887 [Pomphorhynchus laevis]|nr:hypothetical protein GJ496_010887 [Pomphorhynchus laevis]